MDSLYVKQQQLEDQLADNELYNNEKKAELATALEEKSVLDKAITIAEEQWLEVQHTIENIN